jgi:hypothetical protein
MRIPTCVPAAALAFVAVFAAVGCEKSSDDAFAGVWVGDAVDSQDSANRKELTLSLGAADTIVSGTYRLKAVILDTSGIVNGTLIGSEVALVLTPSANDCPYRISGTWNGSRITGTYAAFNCFVRSDGTFSLEKK